MDRAAVISIAGVERERERERETNFEKCFVTVIGSGINNRNIRRYHSWVF